MNLRLPCAIGLFAGMLALCPAIGCAASPERDATASAPQTIPTDPTLPKATPEREAKQMADAGSVSDTGSKPRAESKLGSGAKPGGPMPDTWHATTFVSGGMGVRLIYYWSKGDWMRAETVIGGHPIVTIVRDQDYTSFDRLTGRGLRIRRSPHAIKDDADRSRPFGNDLQELIKEGAVKIEETSQSGIEVEIWRITDDSGRRKLWLTRGEPQLPMRLENFVRGGGDTITTDYSDWARGLEIPDAFFTAPSNAGFVEFEYDAFVAASAERSIGPILYPDLLHGSIGSSAP